MAQEYFDVLDGTGKKTGEVIARDEAHRTGVWHGAFHCIIITEHAGKGSVIFQKRSMNKKVAAGLFDVSVGGHYATGEDAAIAGPREIKEEVGLDVRFDELVPLGRRIGVYCFTPGVLEYEFQDVFLLLRSVPLSELVLQREELDGVIKMEVDSGIRLFSGKVASVECSLYATGKPEERVKVASDEFVQCLDNYYLKLLLLVQRYLQDERDLLLI
jgi:8-oxo-dGTP pyrophosphatase MutT (NUDIX family)